MKLEVWVWTTFLIFIFFVLSTELAQKLVTGLGQEKSKLFVPDSEEEFTTDGDMSKFHKKQVEEPLTGHIWRNCIINEHNELNLKNKF